MTELTKDQGSQFDHVTEALRHLDGAVESLILNDTALLEGLAQMLSAIHQIQAKNEENQKRLIEQFQEFSLLAASQFGTRNPQKPIVLAKSDFDATNPETGLLQNLYSFLSDHYAVDVGAHVGETTARLLESGYTVFAFEPFPASFAQLQRDVGGNPNLRAFPWAIGSANGKMDLQVAADVSGKDQSDPSLFHTLIPHSMGHDFRFVESLPVEVRSLDDLVQSEVIPASVGLLKIDTEGYDLEVVRGMGNLRAQVVMAEFWDAEHEFGKSGRGRLEELVAEMKRRGYAWQLVIYHIDSRSVISYYHNRRDTVPGSWGNVLFFEEQQLFIEALRWIGEVLPQTLFR